MKLKKVIPFIIISGLMLPYQSAMLKNNDSSGLKNRFEKNVTESFQKNKDAVRETKMTLREISNSRKDELLSFAAERKRELVKQYPIDLAKAQSMNLRIKGVTLKGVEFEFMGFKPDGQPIYYQTNNSFAAITSSVHEVWPGGNASLSLTGTGVVLGEWDAGAVLTTHQEFNNTGVARVTMDDGTSSLSSHSTHVAGTIVAGGVVERVKGMSYQGTLLANDWNSDFVEMAASAAVDELKVSNHSYGAIAGWYWDSEWIWYGPDTANDEEDDDFGRYDTYSSYWDEVAYNAPYYLIVKSSGNDNGDGPGDGGIGSTLAGGGTTSYSHPDDGGASGYDCISNYGNAKNILTVGRVDAIVGGYSQTSDVILSASSSTGPCDDGRIKPDIVAQGTSLYSTDDDANNDYIIKSGTSMSSPVVTGSIGLMLEYQRDLYGEDSPLLSSTVKGLLIHTADEAGSNNGPDYKFGWGLMNIESVIQLMKDNYEGNELHIKEGILYDAQTLNYTINVPSGTSELQATLVWSDPEHASISGIDNTTAALVNDLDFKIIGPLPATTTYYPWKLDGSNPSNAATNSAENDIDNVEQITIASPSSGTYTLKIDHDGSLTDGLQTFSLIVTGNNSTSNSTTSTTTQNSRNVNQGTHEQQIIGIEIFNVDNGYNPVTSFTLNTSGTSNASDISNAKVFYTGTNSYFDTHTQFGSTESNPSSSFSVSGSQELALGKNYFWVTYDISTSAIVSHVVDCQCTLIIINGFENTPSVTSPTGSRAITSLTVGSEKTYATIASAISAASSGNVIDIFGTLTESVNILTSDITLILQGQGATSTIVQAAASEASASDRVFEINGTNLDITLRNMTIRYGYISNGGGAIANANTLTLEGCAVTHNRTHSGTYSGGALFTLGTTTIRNCTFSSNQANSSNASAHGGAIYINDTNSPIVTVTNSTFSGNSCGGYGGGICISGSATLNSVNNTFAYNSANYGGGLFVFGTFTLKNTLLSNNTVTTGGPNVWQNSGSTITTHGYNFVEDNTSFIPSFQYTGTPNSNYDWVGSSSSPLDPLINALADNGGATQTHALQSSSPAINQGTDSGDDVLIIDQRGELRKNNPDIGAYEYIGSSSSTATTYFATSVEQTGAILNAQVNPNNDGTTVTFEYGTTVSYGSEIDADPSTIEGVESVNLVGHLSGLNKNTEYHYRVKAVNASGTTYGSDQTFTTNSNNSPVAGSGNALDFDGTDDRVSISDNESLDMSGGDLTIEAWVKPHTHVMSDNNAIIVQKYADVYSLRMVYGAPSMYVRNSSYTSYTATSEEIAIADEWIHVAGVVSLSGGYVRIYVNGVLKASNTAASGTMLESSSSLDIGDDAGSDDAFQGKIDEVRLWNDVRTQGEIQDNMYTPLLGSEDNLMGYWQFDQTSGSAVNDETLYNNDGTLTNMDSGSDWVASKAWQNRYMSNSSIVLSAGYDPDGDDVTLTTSSAPSLGSLSYDNDTETVTYTPNSGANSEDAFCVQISDGSETDTVTFRITSGYLDVAGSGNALNLDGSDDYVRLPEDPEYEFGSSNDFTLELWVKTSSWTSDAPILSSKDWSSKTSAGFTLHGKNDGSGKWAFHIADGTDQVNLDGSVINDGNWHHLAVSVDRDGNAITYQNGVEVSTGSLASIGDIDSNLPICLGQDGNESYGTVFTGQFDEVRIWDDIRSTLEIQGNMCQLQAGNESNLIGYYKTDQAWGDLIYDYSSTFNHGSLKNMADADWVTSGAAIGDTCTVNFSSPASLSLSHNDGDQFSINSITGSPDGAILYRVNEAPNVTTAPGGWNDLYDNRYWGVKIIGGSSPTYSAEYNYDGYPNILNETILDLASRSTNASISWFETHAMLNTTANILTLTGQSGTEYIMGSQNTEVRLQVKVFLEGPYNTSSHEMNTTLQTGGDIPTISPYHDERVVDPIPANIIDWVLVQLRTSASGDSVASRSALLLKDGSIVADDGLTTYIMMNSGTDDYFIVVKHRNHLSIMSDEVHALSTGSSILYDFSTGKNKYYGSDADSLDSGVYGMFTGDATGNDQVQNSDKNVTWRNQVGLAGYREADFDLNGQVQNSDKNVYWRANVGKGTQVP